MALIERAVCAVHSGPGRRIGAAPRSVAADGGACGADRCLSGWDRELRRDALGAIVIVSVSAVPLPLQRVAYQNSALRVEGVSWVKSRTSATPRVCRVTSTSSLRRLSPGFV